jgi:hypothetical protein
MQPVPENFKRRLLAELSSQIPAPASEQAEGPAGLRRPGRGRPALLRHPVMAGAGAAGAVALAAGGFLAAGTGGSPAAPHQFTYTTAAWTVAAHSDGAVDLTIRELRDLPTLQAKLRAAGVPAIVNGDLSTLRCGLPTFSRAIALPPRKHSKVWAAVIHPDALSPHQAVAVNGEAFAIVITVCEPKGHG